VKTSKIGILTLNFVLGMLPSAIAQTAPELAAHAAVPYPTAAALKPIDRGEFSGQSATTPISVTIALSLPKLNEAENLMNCFTLRGIRSFTSF
jgi:hypothetical protein